MPVHLSNCLSTETYISLKGCLDFENSSVISVTQTITVVKTTTKLVKEVKNNNNNN